MCMHIIFWHAWDYILAKFGHIRDIKVSIELGETCPTILWCLCTCMQPYMHAYMHTHYFLAFTGPHLCQIWSDQRDTRYIWNYEIIQAVSDQTIQLKYTSWHHAYLKYSFATSWCQQQMIKSICCDNKIAYVTLTHDDC